MARPLLARFFFKDHEVLNAGIIARTISAHVCGCCLSDRKRRDPSHGPKNAPPQRTARAPHSTALGLPWSEASQNDLAHPTNKVGSLLGHVNPPPPSPA
jgi:hypothetical protein